MSSSHATLSAATDDRKARLAKLKSLKRKQPDGEASPPEPEAASSATTTATTTAAAAASSPSPPRAEVARLQLSGRNYDPETRGPKLGFEAPPTLGLDKPTLEEQAAQLQDDLRQRAEEEAEAGKGIDLFKLQPKKPNWDLKRELDQKLDVLNVRTDNAIAKMVRERLAAKKAAATPSTGAGAAEGDNGGLEGAALVEGIRLREKEEAEEERREERRDREEADLD